MGRSNGGLCVLACVVVLRCLFNMANSPRDFQRVNYLEGHDQAFGIAVVGIFSFNVEAEIIQTQQVIRKKNRCKQICMIHKKENTIQASTIGIGSNVFSTRSCARHLRTPDKRSLNGISVR